MTMNFSERADRMDVRYVARLARIRLTDAEADELQGQLDDILAFVGELKRLDVQEAPPTDDSSGNRNIWHEDVPRPGLPHEAAMALAPTARHGQFVVPKIME
ncbi:MAG: Asp-tRNA(Asn)/Glu-tRNA(Gln) amidotransferase subunit GatC [Verrucomicrobiota bacterium]|jgi:aspartyl-tRNA(Asn)/glutamyl-tRNA(Gln) amidotransferase subunit C|nr:Asp-tRNA(Asn)/Glu-tRNA(Gln) amidotransferase subunit GatC [Verrucomicrobiota bacterium]